MKYALVALLATGWLGLWPHIEQSVKPVVQQPLVLDYRAPEDLAEFVEASEIIVVARITRAQHRRQTTVPGTDYDISVLRTIKGHEHLIGQSKVCRPIGDMEYPDRIVRRFEPGFPPFTVGTEYLLFLTRSESLGCLTPSFGPAGVATVDRSAGLQPLVRHPVLTRLAGSNEIEVEQAIAAAAKRK